MRQWSVNFLSSKPLPRLPAASNLAACAALSLAISLGLGCHAQATKAGSANASTEPSSAASAAGSQQQIERRVHIMVRQKFQVPADVTIQLGKRTPSAFAGYDTLPIIFSRGGNTQPPVDFLISTDGKTLARMQKFDIGQDPSSVVSGAGRPMRGDANAPVKIVVFDDLECPFCARMHEQLFPATLDHYKGKISIAYKDFPLIEIHPWAMHAAVDSNCLFAQSNTAYWNFVDYVHAHAADMGGAQHTLAQASTQLDELAVKQGQTDKLDATKLKACIDKQDDTGIRASMKEGESLGVNATPILFVDGEQIDGAVPTADVWKVIDRALIAKGITPPPPPAATPAPTPAPASNSATPPASTSGAPPAK